MKKTGTQEGIEFRSGRRDSEGVGVAYPGQT